MDCRIFRQQHLAYLDDTLPGDLMTAAQRHIMACDSCAAHDTRVRRSLMVARNLPTVELSGDFTARLHARLAECKRDEPTTDAELAMIGLRDSARPHSWARRATALMAVGTMAVGAIAFTHREAEPTLMSLQPVLASAPAVERAMVPEVTPPLMQAMATGNPMWSAAILIDEMLDAAVYAEYEQFPEYDQASGFQSVSFSR